MKDEGKINFNITSQEDLFEVGIDREQIDELIKGIENKEAILLNPIHITFYFLLKIPRPVSS